MCSSDLRKLKNPREVTNVDGTSNKAGKITRFANLRFKYQGKQKVLPTFVTNLGMDRIILGIEWFKAMNPKIQWNRGSLEGPLNVFTSQGETRINSTSIEWAIKAEQEKKG